MEFVVGGQQIVVRRKTFPIMNMKKKIGCLTDEEKSFLNT